MKVTFPFMGPTFVYKGVLESMGHEVVYPVRPSKETLELGTLYAPEFACFPLKVLMGSYIEAIRRGAEVIVTSGGVGPCRAGWYSSLHKRILKDMGADVEFIVFDPSWNSIKAGADRLRGRTGLHRVARSLIDGVMMVKAYDGLYRQMQGVRTRESSRGDTARVWSRISLGFLGVNPQRLGGFVRESAAELARIPVRPGLKPLRVGVVGEIYVLVEPSVNLGVEERLNHLGCDVERSIYLFEWLCETALPLWMQPRDNREIMRRSKDYIPLCIGGHARQTVGAAKYFADRGFDGVVHLMPFACTPEVVSSGILPGISKDTGMPIMSVSIDEQTAEVNLQTRLEAFTDLMRAKRS